MIRVLVSVKTYEDYFCDEISLTVFASILTTDGGNVPAWHGDLEIRITRVTDEEPSVGHLVHGFWDRRTKCSALL